MTSDADHPYDPELLDLAETPPWEWPEEARNTIGRFLRDSNAPVPDRILAAELGSDIVAISDEMADTFLSILRNDAEPEEVRGAAATSLGPVLEYCGDEFDDPEELPVSLDTFKRIQRTLRDLYTSERVPKLVRRRALEASVRAPEEWHAEAVRSAYSDNDEDWNLTAVFAMNYVPGFDREIVESLDSPQPWIRYHAVGAAGNMGVGAAWPHIAALLSTADTDRDLLLAAIESAPFVNKDEAQELLGRLLDSDDEEVSEAAYQAFELAGLTFEDDFGDEDEEDPFR